MIDKCLITFQNNKTKEILPYYVKKVHVETLDGLQEEYRITSDILEAQLFLKESVDLNIKITVNTAEKSLFPVHTDVDLICCDPHPDQPNAIISFKF